MDELLFLNSHNPVSDRFIILDEMDDVAFIYLTEKGSQQPSKDAIAYMRIDPPKKVNWNEIAKNGEPPILSEELASDSAVIRNTHESQFDFAWSKDGESAALLFENTPIAFVTAKENIGFSKAVCKPNNLTNPWSQELFEQLFLGTFT